MRTNDTLTWLLSDHQPLGASRGSTSLITDAGGAIVSETRYLPYGQAYWQAGASQTDFGFTGQRMDGFGLMDYNARYYDPLLGRFISPDTIIPQPGSPLAWDRFSFVNSNPVRYTDPSGHMMSECGLDNQDCGASVSQIAYETQRYYYENCSSGYGGSCPNYGEAVAFMTLGLMTAGVAGTAIDALGVAVGGTVTSGGVTTTITSLCADGDCENEVRTGINVVDQLFEGNNITVLGRYPTYSNVAKDIGGKIFSVPTEIWNNLSRSEQWVINQQYLDNAIAKGDTFYLASPWADAIPGSFYRMELEYLFSQGYTISLYQNYLLPPAR